MSTPIPARFRPISQLYRSSRTAVLLFIVVVSQFVAAAPVPEFPLPVDESRSTTARQLAKPVLKERLLHAMDSTNGVKLFGPGEMTLSTRSFDHKGAIRLSSPTKTQKPGAVSGRPFGESGIRCETGDADWSEFNRVSLRVYPDLPGFKVVSMLLKLRSEGTEGRSYTDGGMHFVLLRNQQWNHVAWEIEHLGREHVTGFEIIYRLQGNEPGATERVSFDVDDVRLERVDPDMFEGWAPAPGVFAFSHMGYAPNGSKTAIVQPAKASSESTFTLVDAQSGKTAWSGPVKTAELGGKPVTVLDFSAFTREGQYRLSFEGANSQPFRISKDWLREPLLAALNFFYCERCGQAVKGIHDVCHEDWRGERNGQYKQINGGWHDAGDLSQGLANTSEAVWSMLRLAERCQKSDAPMAERLRQEASWGAKWLLKTRFGDGFRVNWATMDFWTDNKLGGPDDVTARAGNSPFENFLAAAAEASCARALRAADAAFSEELAKAAREDFAFGISSMREPGVEVAAAATQAAIELWKLTKSENYRADAERLADLLMASQQTTTPEWDKPLRGFFYTSPTRERILRYNHRSHEQGPVVALVDMCRAWPDAPKAGAWKEAVRLYGEYLIATAQHTKPYNMFAAGIYRTADTSNAGEKKQIENGVRLTEGIYLRRFPVWGDFRGNLGVLLSQATAAANAAGLLHSAELARLAREQLQWTLGRNPFCQSLMYGVGHNYAPQYTAVSGNMTGSLPVGIQTRLEQDVPYWPVSNVYNYAEVWVHPASRFFSTAAELLD